MRSEIATRLRRLLKLEFYFTAVPAIVFPASFFVSIALFPPAAVVISILAFIYLLPAFAIVNGLGYKTVEGSPPLPIPASSLSALLVLIATHAALVAAIYMLWLGVAATMRWADRAVGRASERMANCFKKPDGPPGPP